MAHLNAEVIHTAIEPGIIDNAMIAKCILEYGKQESSS